MSESEKLQKGNDADPVDSSEVEYFTKAIPEALEGLKRKPSEVSQLLANINNWSIERIGSRIDLRNRVISVNDDLDRALNALRSLVRDLE